MKPLIFEYSSLTRLRLGEPVVAALVAELAELPKARVFVLMSGTLARQSTLPAELELALGNRLAGVFAGIRAHSPREDVLSALHQAWAANADVIVTIGGGSVIDAGKVLQFCLNAGIEDEQALLRYARFSDGSTGELCGTTPVSRREQPVFQISVPTTLSGAEYSNNAGITDLTKGAKEGYKAPGLCARRIIYDPQLATLTPQWLWLSTAVRSLDHAIEGYCSSDAHPYVQGQFLHAMRLFADSLPAMKASPADTDTRLRNQQATWLACAGLGNIRHGASHGIGYILGAMCGIPHGYTSCLMLPAVLRWNESVNGKLQKDIATALGADQPLPASWLKNWLRELELPVSLEDAGVTRQMLPGIAEAAARHSVVRSNPRPISSADAVLEILELAW